MANTEFYERIRTDADRITWKDIFSEFRIKHTKKDVEYALLAGTSLDTATDLTMLQKWRKPWLFYRMLIGGAALIGIIYFLVFGCIRIFGSSDIAAVNLIFVMIPPLVVPLVLMVFFWELNVPRNISIYQMIGYFFVGGMLSLVITLVVGIVAPSGKAAYAPFSEEPGKLAASLLFLYLFAKKGRGRVYGITGLVIGAAVGAGFGGFESAQYAYNVVNWPAVGGFYIWQEAFEAIIQSEIIRGILALGGHTLFCAPYTAAVALHMKNDKFDKECFINKDFAITFGCSFVMHFIWNSNLGIGYLQYILVIAVLWFSTLYITRKCFRQVVEAGRYHGNCQAGYRNGSKKMGTVQSGVRSVQAAKSLTVQCISGPVKGAVWRPQSKEVLVIGRDAECSVCLSSNAAGISRKHCSIQQTKRGWTIRDLNSSYGTYVGDSGKLVPGIDRPLCTGEVFYLGGKGCAFRVDIK